MKRFSLVVPIFKIVIIALSSCVRDVQPSPTGNVTQTTTIPPAATKITSTPVPKAQSEISAPIVSFGDNGYTTLGTWSTNVSVSPAAWQPGIALDITANLTLPISYLTALSKTGVFYDGFCLLVTAERTFDSKGTLRLADDEKMSTLVTPTGLAIEGGVQGAVTKRFGYGFNTPVDEFVVESLNRSQNLPDRRQITFNVQTKLPGDLPPGIYRVRLDYGLTAKGRYYSLNLDSFAVRPFFIGRPTESHIYSPLIRANGTNVSGRRVDASSIKPRIPWVILLDYNSNGYNGVVADEDKGNFALSPRNIIPDDVILPLYGPDNKTKIAYSLEPRFPADTIELRSNIPWDFSKGELSTQITGPDGKTSDLGTSPFVGAKGQWPTTNNPTLTNWKPPAYGQYTVRLTGWIEDIWGNRYDGGGTYQFWIAKRMTVATATFQGQSYPVGSRYGRDLGFDPAVPADVQVTASLYPGSNQTSAKTVTYSGKATVGGIFGSAQGAIPLMLDSPGEYSAHVLATYRDQEGHLWVSSIRHAGVVYAVDSPIAAHGKKLSVNGKLVDRGETNTEGYIDTDNVSHLQHINYPFQSGDMLLIASEQTGSDKIEPVLTYDLKDGSMPYDPRLQTIGITNLKLKTSNGYSPHLFPEYITDWAYYYAGAPRPGFMSRFLVGEDGVRAPYWPTSPNSFGSQIAASNNGDLPGVIYRLIGGIVIRQKGQSPGYAGYMSNGFILPKGSNNNRIVADGSEELLGSDGTYSRLFLVSTRPGMIYETGTAFSPAVQIDPILPAAITYILTYPDGRQVTARGQGDQFGSFVGADKWILDMPGIYHYTLEADWQGHKGYMPGLPRQGGDFYVIEKDKPASVPSLKLNLPEQSSFSPAGTLTITGNTTSKTVSYAAVIPGAVIAQGSVPVNGGKFSYTFDPATIARAIPLYDIINMVNGKPEIKDVVQLTFFSTETAGSNVYHTAVRVILRGTTVLYVY